MVTALVVYESAWGNTKAVADAVAEGLTRHLRTEVVDVAAAPPLQGLQTGLLVVGAPTHAFGLSRAATREDAHRRGGSLLPTGVREWLDAAERVELTVATFDTHVRHPNLPGAASQRAAKKLRRLGCTVVVEPQSFYVEDYEGPLLPGEIDRARTWGVALARHTEITGEDA